MDYYERRAQKNAETVEFVLTHWGAIIFVLMIVGIVGDAWK